MLGLIIPGYILHGKKRNINTFTYMHFQTFEMNVFVERVFGSCTEVFVFNHLKGFQKQQQINLPLTHVA